MGHLAQTGLPSSQNPGLLSPFSTFPLPCWKGRGHRHPGQAGLLPSLASATRPSLHLLGDLEAVGLIRGRGWDQTSDPPFLCTEKGEGPCGPRAACRASSHLP